MTLVAYNVDFFMGKTNKKTIKIGQEIEILYSNKKKKTLLAPPQKTGGLFPPKSIPTFIFNQLSIFKE